MEMTGYNENLIDAARCCSAAVLNLAEIQEELTHLIDERSGYMLFFADYLRLRNQASETVRIVRDLRDWLDAEADRAQKVEAGE